MKLMTEYWY